MKLSEHFTLEEFTRSQTALRKGIINKPNDDEIKNMITLCENVLEPLREKLKKPIYISSGYRCKVLNYSIGGVASSQHILGQAVDINVIGMSAKELYEFIKDSGILVDQCILEYNSWVHLSYAKPLRNNFFEIN